VLWCCIRQLPRHPTADIKLHVLVERSHHVFSNSATRMHAFQGEHARLHHTSAAGCTVQLAFH
jgi:hypothetical protein